MERKVIVITGPTGSGKTDLSILLAQKLNTEIISADSRQFYKYLDIGTAKPEQEEIQKVKHHLISFLYPDQDYNISKFRKEAMTVCETLWLESKIPIISGGSGLYIKSFIDGISETPDPDPDFRETLLNEKKLYGAEYLYNKLLAVDPESASGMLPQNWKRIIRALEVNYLTGKPIWQHHQEQKYDHINAIQYGIDWERQVLYERINKRVDKMINRGLVEEVKHLLSMGYDRNLNSLNSVGYKEIFSYLDGYITIDKAVELIKRNSRRYAKRQMTWFRKDNRIKWLTINSYEELHIFAERIANEYLGEMD